MRNIVSIYVFVDPFEHYTQLLHTYHYYAIAFNKHNVFITRQPYVIVYINPMLIKCWHAKANITYVLWFNFKCNIKVITTVFGVAWAVLTNWNWNEHVYEWMYECSCVCVYLVDISAWWGYIFIKDVKTLSLYTHTFPYMRFVRVSMLMMPVFYAWSSP